MPFYIIVRVESSAVFPIMPLRTVVLIPCVLRNPRVNGNTFFTPGFSERYF